MAEVVFVRDNPSFSEDFDGGNLRSGVLPRAVRHPVMSISLGIRWMNGDYDVIPISGQSTAREVWGGLGDQLGLKWVSRFHQWIPVQSDNLHEIMNDVEAVLLYSQTQGTEWDPIALTAGRLLEALRTMRDCSGWEASIG